jgi:hypothetical protein
MNCNYFTSRLLANLTLFALPESYNLYSQIMKIEATILDYSTIVCH